MDLAPIGPLGGPPGPLSGSTRPLLGPGLGPAPVGVDHLLDGLGVVVVDGVVGLLPDHVLVDDVNTGIHGPHVGVQAQQGCVTENIVISSLCGLKSQIGMTP